MLKRKRKKSRKKKEGEGVRSEQGCYSEERKKNVRLFPAFQLQAVGGEKNSARELGAKEGKGNHTGRRGVKKALLSS